MREVDVAIIGAGAAGLAAAHALADHPLSVAVLEARDRIGGRAHTVQAGGLPLDLGCGWLHSADRNILADLLAKAGVAIDKTPPHWESQSLNADFPPSDQRAFGQAFDAFEQRLADAAKTGRDQAAADFFDPACRWNRLIDAVSSYYNGAEFDQVSVLDYAAYDDSDVNWRVAGGYGAAIERLYAAPPGLSLNCAVREVRHDGRRCVVVTDHGGLSCRAVIVTLPTPLLAALKFTPDLPDKRDAAHGLPLGLADKVMLAVEYAQDLPREGHLFGRPGCTATGSYHLRPFGRPYIECFLGGRWARTLEAEGQGAAADFAIGELSNLLGSDFRKRLTPLAATRWAGDPWARGSYSHALPGQAGARAVLAAPVDERLVFAGEATSPHAYSTCHGAWETGLRAADEVLAALSRGAHAPGRQVALGPDQRQA